MIRSSDVFIPDENDPWAAIKNFLISIVSFYRPLNGIGKQLCKLLQFEKATMVSEQKVNVLRFFLGVQPNHRVIAHFNIRGRIITVLIYRRQNLSWLTM